MSYQSDSTPNRGFPALLSALYELLEKHQGAFKQARVWMRVQALVLALLFSFARKTLTQLLVTMGALKDDWSCWYRLFSHKRIDYDRLTSLFVRETLEHVAVKEFYPCVVDATSVARCSLKMPGTFWGKGLKTPKFRPGIQRQQRFEHLCWLTPPEQGFSRGVPLRWNWAAPEKAVPTTEPARKEWEAAQKELVWLRGQLDETQRRRQRILCMGDGNYDVKGIWKALPHDTVLIARCRKDRKLYELPPHPSSARRRGRPLEYGSESLRPQQWLHEKEGWQESELLVRGKSQPVRYRVEGPFLVEGAPERPLYLLVIKGHTVKSRSGKRSKYYDPVYLLCNALRCQEQWVLPAPATELLFWVRQRWEIEVCHREIKSGFGLGQMQCWSQAGSLLNVQWMAWVYAVLVLAGYRTWGLCQSSAGTLEPWKRRVQRWSFNTLWRAYRQALWGEMAQGTDLRGCFQAVWTGILHERPKKQIYIDGLWNAVWGSVRA